MTLLAIIAGTLLSEDLTCIAAGLLVSRRELALPIALLGCFIGILLGDLALWLVGRYVGASVLDWPRVRKRLPADRVEQLAEWFHRHGFKAVLAARFVPGTRFPVYLAAGALGRRSTPFLWWAVVAGLLWTPLLVGLVAIFGAKLAGPLERLFEKSGLALVLASALIFLLLRLMEALSTEIGRARLVANVSRLWRWEFWPMWLFYLPLAPYLAWLALRHKGPATITAANPGIPLGGIVGESKYDILRRLPPEWIVQSRHIDRGAPQQRGAALERAADELSLPLILKPDAGERGRGVILARDLDRARAYVRRVPAPLLAQAYHPGPSEAGIFYYRMPDEGAGRILSITDKQFAVLEGDGRSTIETLIWRHPRYRMQARVFLARLNGQTHRTPAAGERVPLAIAGNHCQGTLFRDGQRLWTPQLEQRIDEVARGFDGFFFGRFDVRYADEADLMAGRGFAIIELNGATSESTNLYDPSWSLRSAYAMLFKQWRVLFEVGYRNRVRGCPVASLSEVGAALRRHFAQQRAPALSD